MLPILLTLLLLFVLPIIFITGMLHPIVFAKLTGGIARSRGKGALALLGVAMVLFIGIGITGPKAEPDSERRTVSSSVVKVVDNDKTLPASASPVEPAKPDNPPQKQEEGPGQQNDTKKPLRSSDKPIQPQPAPAQQEKAPTPTQSPSTPTPAPKSPQQCAIKGNISSKKEKIYHVPGGAYYSKTIIDHSKGERWFCSEKEAVNAGWRASKR